MTMMMTMMTMMMSELYAYHVICHVTLYIIPVTKMMTMKMMTHMSPA